MRLIKADALIAQFHRDAMRLGGLEEPWDLSAIETEIESATTIDAVPVVRCKDCKRSKEFEDHLVCNHALPTKSIDQYFMVGTDILAIVKPDDFCSHGDRKDGVE